MKLFLLILTALGIAAIYDARKITIKYFSNQDQNKMAITLKILGFLVCAICGTLLCIIK